MRRRPPARARAGHVAAQAFEPPSVRACDPRCRMQGKAAGLLLPERLEAFDRIYGARFERLIRQFLRGEG